MPASRAAWVRLSRFAGRVEVVVGCSLDAVGAVAEVGGVEVVLQDLRLGQVVLDPDGVPQLVELAGVVLRRCRLALLRAGGVLLKRQLDELLGDRRTTLDDLVAGLVDEQGAQRAPDVERAVLVEAGVLDRDQGVLDIGRDLVQRDVLAVLVVERRELASVGGQHPGALVERLEGQLLREALDCLRAVLGALADQADPGKGQTRHQRPGEDADADDHDDLVDQTALVPRGWTEPKHGPQGT